MYIKEFVQALVPHIYRLINNDETVYNANQRLYFKPFDEYAIFKEGSNDTIQHKC